MDAQTGLFEWISASTAVKLAIVAVLASFLPLNALTYQRFRSCRRKAKIERTLQLLKMGGQDRERYLEIRAGRFLCIAVTYATLVSVLGLTILLFSEQMKLGIGSLAGQESWLIFGMGFLGGYLWGIQYVLRRYSVDDLNPGVYHALAIRMVLAGVLAVVFFNAHEALIGEGAGMSEKIWPALALVLGMFPQRGVTWIRDRIPFLSDNEAASVRNAPLEIIEGITVHDRLRLEEEGIDNCYDLATADFVPLVINTPYSARGLIDWLLQAKLCIYVPEAIMSLRQQGVRTILDLGPLDDAALKGLAEATAVTKAALERAQKSLRVDPQIDRLRHVGDALSRFSGIEDPLPLHLVVGGKLKNSGGFEFADCTKLKLVGIYPHHEAAQDACKEVARRTAGDTNTRYFIGHVHRLVDPDTREREREHGESSGGPAADRGALADGHAALA